MKAAECQADAVYELDWIISEDTVVRPDVMVICGGIPDEHLRETPALVAEVISESTATRDRTYKRDLYDEQGVNVYLLLDSDAKTLEAYQRDRRGVWQHQQVTGAIEFRLCDRCQVHLESTTLFTS